jgi:hypothetical protein
MHKLADKRPTLKASLVIFAAIVLTTAPGCNSGSKSGTAESRGNSDSTAHLEVGCILDHVEKPAESFHYSYKYADPSTWHDYEADVTPNSIDGIVKNPGSSTAVHAKRSDDTGWGSAVLSLSSLSFTALTGHIVGIEGTSAVTSQGAQNVNGYGVTKYAIDTASANAADQRQYTTLFGTGSFEKGTIWMGQDGCAVKVIMDEGVSIDGNIQKRHYEISRALKQ